MLTPAPDSHLHGEQLSRDVVRVDTDYTGAELVDGVHRSRGCVCVFSRRALLSQSMEGVTGSQSSST